MSTENLGVDLFGDPVAAGREGPGRPEVVWNRETSNRVLLGFALGWTVKRVAELVGLSCPTLRKVYFSEVEKRRLAADRLELRQLALLAEQTEKGNVGASKELDRRIEKLRTAALGERITKRGRQAEPKKGKKQLEREAASGVEGRFRTRQAPQGLQ